MGNGERNCKGQIMIFVLLIIVTLALLIPSMVFLQRRDTVGTVDSMRSTKAYHLAESGMDRATWKLNEAASVFEDVKNSVAITDYKNDRVYTDVEGGEYKINMTTHPTDSDTILVRVTGRDFSTNKVRCILAEYKKTSVQGPVEVSGNVEYKPNMKVHWGPVFSFTSMDYQPSDYWPRKYCKGAIEGRDTNPSPPNSDEKEYWAFYTQLGSPPEVDLAVYKTRAKSTRIPSPKKGKCGALATDDIGEHTSNSNFKHAGSASVCMGYFPSTVSGAEDVEFSKDGTVEYNWATGIATAPGANFLFYVDTPTIYCEKKCKIKDGTYLQGNLVIEGDEVEAGEGAGNIHIHGNGKSLSVPVPPLAYREYVKGCPSDQGTTGDSTEAGEYPGDNGYQVVISTYYTIPDCVIHGFLYVHGEWHCSGGVNSMYGVGKVKGEMEVNTFTLYYSSGVAAKVVLSKTPIYRTSWKEVPAEW